MSLEEKNTPIVVTNNLSKNYGVVEALKDVTISLEPGIWGLVGPNGAGKTTFLNLLWGVIYPTSGTLRVLGHDPTKDDVTLKNKLGVSFTSQQLPAGYSCESYLQMVAKVYAVPPDLIGSLAYKLLKALELDHAKDRNVKQLSSGMAQKVAIAQCLIGLPRLGILDEPFANLDPHIKLYTSELIAQFHESLGSSFIISSHSLEDLASFCTHYLVIDRGKVLWKGSSKEVSNEKLLDFYMQVTGRKRPF